MFKSTEPLLSDPNYFINIRRKIVWFVNQYEDKLCTTVFEPASELSDRLQDIWEGLFKLAEFMDGGGDALYAAKEAAIQISQSARIDAPSLRIELLKDIKGLLTGYVEDFVETSKLKNYLVSLSDRPWKYLQGRELTPHKLAELLKPFGIEPTQLRFNKQPVRGYARSALQEAITRYL